MAETKTKPEETAPEDLQSLPAGHPEAGYVTPDLSYTDSVGKVPAEEQKARDEQTAAQQAEAEAVAKHEHEVAVAEQAETAKVQAEQLKQPSTTSS